MSQQILPDPWDGISFRDILEFLQSPPRKEGEKDRQEEKPECIRRETLLEL